MAKLVSFDDLQGWSITRVKALWEAINQIADSKACIQQRDEPCWMTNCTVNSRRRTAVRMSSSGGYLGSAPVNHSEPACSVSS